VSGATGPTVAERLAEFAAGVLDDGAPAAVRASVRDRVLDVLGLQAAALTLPTSTAALRFVVDQGGAAQASVVGRSERVPAPAAAFANGVLAHSLDYDDTHLPSVLHPSASVVPATLAAAELVGASGAAVLDAAAGGIETVVRLGMAGYDRERRASIFFDHGQHATSICGALGSGVSAALLMGLGARGVVDTIGVAASMASGIIEGNRTGGTVKRLHCGWAAQIGVTAAMLVEGGFTGPPTAIEGRFGLLEAFLHGAGDPDAITEGLGSRWEVPGIFFKPYPANHFTHTALDAAARMAAAGLRAEDVESAELGVATSTVRTIGEPIEVKRAPETGYQAQFSGPYMVALGLLGGGGLGASLDDFRDELVRAPERRALMARITVVPDAECDAVFPDQFPAVLRVVTRDGSRLEERVMVNRGGPERPLAPEELRTKFRDNLRRSYAEDLAAPVEAAVAALEGADSDGVRSMVEVLARRPEHGVAA
jgi:2-methylcitrate dehydratase PrpD